MTKRQSKKRESKHEARPKETKVEFLASLAEVLATGLFIITFMVQAFAIPSSSMENTLLVGDHVFVDRIQFAPASDRPRGVLGFATCETSHPELAETLKPTKLHQWRSAKLDATLSPPSPPRQLRG